MDFQQVLLNEPSGLLGHQLRSPPITVMRAFSVSAVPFVTIPARLQPWRFISSIPPCAWSGEAYLRLTFSLTLTQRHFWRCEWYTCSSRGFSTSPRRHVWWVAAGASQDFFLYFTESVSGPRCCSDCRLLQLCNCS